MLCKNSPPCLSLRVDEDEDDLEEEHITKVGYILLMLLEAREGSL